MERTDTERNLLVLPVVLSQCRWTVAEDNLCAHLMMNRKWCVSKGAIISCMCKNDISVCVCACEQLCVCNGEEEEADCETLTVTRGNMRGEK